MAEVQRDGPLICRECGYDLAALGGAMRAVICPECGQENDPDDLEHAPLRPEPWPGVVGIGVRLFWPSLFGPAAVVGALVEPAFGVVFAGVGLLLCTSWPIAMVTWMLTVRVPRRACSKLIPLVTIGGIAGNLVLGLLLTVLVAVGVTMLTYLTLP